MLQEFKCEICGNYSYWGRRAYEKHFKEWRHQNGMRALGIPNNKMFYEVTKIDEALELWKSIQVGTHARMHAWAWRGLGGACMRRQQGCLASCTPPPLACLAVNAALLSMQVRRACCACARVCVCSRPAVWMGRIGCCLLPVSLCRHPISCMILTSGRPR